MHTCSFITCGLNYAKSFTRNIVKGCLPSLPRARMENYRVFSGSNSALAVQVQYLRWLLAKSILSTIAMTVSLAVVCVPWAPRNRWGSRSHQLFGKSTTCIGCIVWFTFSHALKRGFLWMELKQWRDHCQTRQEGPGCFCWSRSCRPVVVAVVYLPPPAPWTPGMASGRTHPGPLSPGHGWDWEEIRGYIHCVGR